MNEPLDKDPIILVIKELWLPLTVILLLAYIGLYGQVRLDKTIAFVTQGLERLDANDKVIMGNQKAIFDKIK